MLRQQVLTVCIVGLVMALAGAPANAGILTTLDTGLGGLFQGSQSYAGTCVTLQVDYAVFKPGYFPYSPTPAIPADQYVYAYQLNSLFAGPNPSWAYVIKFSIGLQGNESPGVVGYYSDGLAGETLPSKSAFVTNNTAVGWDWPTNALIASVTGAHSPILYFTSPYLPETDTASVSGFIPVATHLMPSPTPEPATLSLLALGGLTLLRRRVRA